MATPTMELATVFDGALLMRAKQSPLLTCRTSCRGIIKDFARKRKVEALKPEQSPELAGEETCPETCPPLFQFAQTDEATEVERTLDALEKSGGLELISELASQIASQLFKADNAEMAADLWPLLGGEGKQMQYLNIGFVCAVQYVSSYLHLPQFHRRSVLRYK